MKCLFVILSLALSITLISCGNDTNRRQGPNYNYNNYQTGKRDFHSHRGNRYRYNWNNYNGQYLSHMGPNNYAFCGHKYRDTNGLCYVSCMERSWNTVTGYQTGLVWTCSFQGCGWHTVAANRTWYVYNWVPVYRPVSCY